MSVSANRAAPGVPPTVEGLCPPAIEREALEQDGSTGISCIDTAYRVLEISVSQAADCLVDRYDCSVIPFAAHLGGLAVETPYLQYLNRKYRFPRSLVHRPIHQFFVRHLAALPRGTTLLDAGCGNGMESGSLADDLRVYGVDYQAEYITHCQETYPAGTYQVGDLNHLSFSDGFFDAIMLNQVIEHVADPQRLMRELRRVLAPGGLLLVATPNYGNFLWPLVECTYHRWFAADFDAAENHVTHYDRSLLHRHMEISARVQRVDTICFGSILVASGRGRA